MSASGSDSEIQVHNREAENGETTPLVVVDDSKGILNKYRVT